MHITTKSFILRYFCPPCDFKVKLKVTKSLILGGNMSTAGQEKSRLTPTCTYMDDMQERCFSLLKLDLNIKKKKKKR